MHAKGRCKCLHCGTFFIPDPRNRHHQQYCGEPECRRASKAASQRRWQSRPENADYFRGAENVARVQAWRKAHPGYWMLSLDSEQRKQVKDLRDHGEKAAAPVRDQLAAAQLEIAQSVQAGKSQDEIGETIDAYAVLDTQMTAIELRSLAKISKVLTQEQQARLGGLFWMMRGIFKNRNWNDAGGW